MKALIGLANIHYFQGRAADAQTLEALSLGREAGDTWAVSVALFLQALAALERRDDDRAVACAQEAREAAHASGDSVEHGGPLFALGHVAASHGDHDRAQQLYEESIAVHRRAGETWGLGILLVAAAAMRIILNDYQQARAQASEALSLFQELEDPRGIAWSLEVCAGLLAAEGQADGAARLWSAAAQEARTHWRRTAAEHPCRPGSLYRASQNLDRRGRVQQRLRRRTRDAARGRARDRAASGTSTRVTFPMRNLSRESPWFQRIRDRSIILGSRDVSTAGEP